MINFNEIESAEAVLVRIYTSPDSYKDLSQNKTLDMAEVCELIGRIKLQRSDLGEALHFYREALDLALGENNRNDIEQAISEVEAKVQEEINGNDETDDNNN